MISIMLCYARSGGTLLSRCLGSMPDVALLSEVNPLYLDSDGDRRTVVAQAADWYGIKLDAVGFPAAVKELHEKRGGNLIVRDWTIANFYPYGLNGRRPSYEFKVLDGLNGCKVFSFVRDAIDVWLSRNCDVQFARYYLRYVQELLRLDCRIFRYEDLCLNPTLTLRRICKHIEVEYRDVTETYMDYDRVTGCKKGRGVNQKEIKPLTRLDIPKDKDMRELININKLLGYY